MLFPIHGSLSLLMGLKKNGVDIQDPSDGCTAAALCAGDQKEHGKRRTVLGNTSLPIGGNNTNSVIAGHRGYQGAPYFREIEKLQIGDKVYIKNQWESITYIVKRIKDCISK